MASPSAPAAPVDPMQCAIPETLNTERLCLRPFALADAPALQEALAESFDHLRTHLWFLPWLAEAPTLASATLRCRRAAANFLLRTDLAYLILHRDSGRLLGSVGLHRTDWSLPKTEVGYWLRDSACGQGFATEAVQALTEWALNGLGAQRVELVTDPLNHASRAVAERCGFVLEGVLHNTLRAPDGQLRGSCIYARWPDSLPL